MEDVFSTREFCRRFFDLTPDSLIRVDLGSRDPLCLKVQPAASRDVTTLVILFHGALGRSKGVEVPAFLNFRRAASGQAHQISISDPGLQADNQVGTGWFAGSVANPAQELLPGFFQECKETLGIDRVIFVGSSAGGYGALFYSWCMPGSIVCASVPQTNIREYHEGTWRGYFSQCWPDGENSRGFPITDLRELYSRIVPNVVVYIQSSRDVRQLGRHMIPFLSAIPVGERGRVALKVSYWGREGHSGAVPPDELDGWLRAAIGAEHPTAESIIDYYQRSGVELTPLSQTLMRGAGARPIRSVGGANPDANDMSQQLRFRDLTWSQMVVDAIAGEGA